MTKFSIIIPVYNVEDYIENCLKSIVNQSYKDYEALLICDKSSDNSEKIVDKYVKKYKTFKKIYEEKTGLAKAKNIGIQHAKGDYIMFLDSDDYIEKDLLETISNNLEEKIDVLRFQAREIKNDNTIDYNEK